MDLPDPVFRRAKATAAERGQALREFVTEALQEKMSGRSVRPVRTPHRGSEASRVAEKLGRPIPANDVWIAALALQYRLPILRRDTHCDDVQACAATRGRPRGRRHIVGALLHPPSTKIRLTSFGFLTNE